MAKDISSDVLAEGVRAGGLAATATTREEVLANARTGDSYVVFGARDESLAAFAQQLAKKVKGDRAAATRGKTGKIFL